jgi:hypothetical protein
VLLRVLEHSDAPGPKGHGDAIQQPRRTERPSSDDDSALESASLQFMQQTLDRARTRDDSLETREVELPAICPHRSG